MKTLNINIKSTCRFFIKKFHDKKTLTLIKNNKKYNPKEFL